MVPDLRPPTHKLWKICWLGRLDNYNFFFYSLHTWASINLQPWMLYIKMLCGEVNMRKNSKKVLAPMVLAWIPIPVISSLLLQHSSLPQKLMLVPGNPPDATKRGGGEVDICMCPARMEKFPKWVACLCLSANSWGFNSVFSRVAMAIFKKASFEVWPWAQH